MPNTKSALKRMHTSQARNQANRAAKSRLSLTRRQLYEAIDRGDATGSEASFREYCSRLDKAVKSGTIKRNNASRRKSRAAARLAKLA